MLKSDDNKWLETLKEGDRVFITNNAYSEEDWTLDTVKNLTKTMIVLEKTNLRFKRETARIHGTALHPYTQEMIDKYYLYMQKKRFKYLLSVLQSTPVFESITREGFDRINPVLTQIRDELIPKKLV
jgi:hypothetical protein